MSDSYITRQRRGKGFSYYDGESLLSDTSELQRVRKLAIPPAWTEVRISKDHDEKVLATGIDSAGRRQAIYHPDFRAAQDQAKFERIMRFAKSLPHMRKQIEHDLASRRLSKEKVLACVVRLMDEAYFRVGNQQYAKENGHYGITTLRSKHADIRSTSVTFDFVGKSGQKHHKTVSDRQIARIIKQLDDLPGYEIFKYIDDDGTVRNIDSGDVNDYIKQHMGDEYSAKDFRTWGGTLLASAELAAAEKAENERQRKRIINTCVRNVAKRLGNTPAVTRSSYIDPRIIDAYNETEELSEMRQAVEKLRPQKYMKPEERCVLNLLRQAT
jgi:DNA topoisomerase-1